MPILLNKNLISSPLPLEIFDSIDSTNNYLLNHSQYDSQICLAETQTAGRGRADKTWISPYGQNIYFSLKISLKKFMGLSLVMSLAVIKTLKFFAPETDFMAKWPNDVLYGPKKIAGILIEIQHNTHAIIGIGININMLQEPWGSLKEILKTETDRNKFCTGLIKNILDYIQLFESHDFKYFLSEWDKIDYLKNKNITIQNITGVMTGVNNQGNLLLSLPSGEIREINSGEAHQI